MTETKRPLKVFLCHAHADRDAVRSLYARLTKDGVDAWLDKEKLLPGQDWELEIRKAVREADVVVVCLSKQFNQAGFRQKEVRLALDTAMEKPEGEIFIIPARLEECDILESLRKWHWVNLFEKDGYKILMKALNIRASSIGVVLQTSSRQSKKVSSSSNPRKQESVQNLASSSRTQDTYETYSVGDVSDYLLTMPKDQLQQLANVPLKKGDYQATLRKVLATNALTRIESGQVITRFWETPYGEPEWVTIPAGEFWMGSKKRNYYYDEYDLHKLYLPEFQVSRVPVTNEQYNLYIKDSGAKPPEHWRSEQMLAGAANHPVTDITWYAMLNYCRWLGEKIHRAVTIPSEAEWEKAARGDQDQREYPWGDWADLHCNSNELGIGNTIPVGLFLNGASPYGVLDMSGNVWEWTRSLWSTSYNYKVDKEHEDLDAPSEVYRVLRGGSFNNDSMFVRCICRDKFIPDFGLRAIGFRVVVFPMLPS